MVMRSAGCCIEKKTESARQGIVSCTSVIIVCPSSNIGATHYVPQLAQNSPVLSRSTLRAVQYPSCRVSLKAGCHTEWTHKTGWGDKLSVWTPDGISLGGFRPALNSNCSKPPCTLPSSCLLPYVSPSNTKGTIPKRLFRPADMFFSLLVLDSSIPGHLMHFPTRGSCHLAHSDVSHSCWCPLPSIQNCRLRTIPRSSWSPLRGTPILLSTHQMRVYPLHIPQPRAVSE